jgi:hypothetical protein
MKSRFDWIGIFKSQCYFLNYIEVYVDLFLLLLSIVSSTPELTPICHLPLPSLWPSQPQVTTIPPRHIFLNENGNFLLAVKLILRIIIEQLEKYCVENMVKFVKTCFLAQHMPILSMHEPKKCAFVFCSVLHVFCSPGWSVVRPVYWSLLILCFLFYQLLCRSIKIPTINVNLALTLLL